MPCLALSWSWAVPVVGTCVVVGPNQGFGCGPWSCPHPPLAVPLLGQGLCWFLQEIKCKGLGRTRAVEPGSVRVKAEQGCPHLGWGRRDHRVPPSPSWWQGCLLRVQEGLHCCWCFLGWLDLPSQCSAPMLGDQHCSQWL